MVQERAYVPAPVSSAQVVQIARISRTPDSEPRAMFQLANIVVVVMIERRIENRRKSEWPALISSRNTILKATILDSSAFGARVRLDRTAFLGTHCSINASLFENELLCRIIWRSADEVGLRFKLSARSGMSALPARPMAAPPHP